MATSKKNEGIQEIVIERPKRIEAKITLVGDTPLLVHAWSEKAKKEMLEAQQKLSVAKKAKDIRDPFAEFMSAAYWLDGMPDIEGMSPEEEQQAFEDAIAKGARFGFPTIAVKLAALSACYRAGKIPNQVGMKCSFYLNGENGGDLGTGSELAVILHNGVEFSAGEPDDKEAPKGKKAQPVKESERYSEKDLIVPELREDMVKIGGMTKVADLRYRPVFKDWKIHLTVTLIDTGVFTMKSIINAIDYGGMANGIGEWRMEKNGDFGRYHVELGWI